MPSVSLIVLRAANVEASLRFYQTIGFAFVQEQHGNGPIHYSSQSEGIVLEIYPGRENDLLRDRRNAGETMIGFQIDDLAKIVEALQQLGMKVITSPQSSEWGLRAVVQDPDSRAVELTQPVAT
jgi:lactoylglutathione lyase